MLMLIWTLALYGFAAIGVATTVFVAGVASALGESPGAPRLGERAGFPESPQLRATEAGGRGQVPDGEIRTE
jgi:hypothetical protein